MKTVNKILCTLLFGFASSLSTALDLSPRVVGGTESAEGDWPWMVTVFPDGYLCGGTLIAENIVLTAAHCLHDEDNEPFTASEVHVVVGGYDLADAHNVTVSNVYVHPDYDQEAAFSNDIALLILTDSVIDAVIPRADATTTSAAIDDGDNVTVVGWGTTTAFDLGEEAVGDVSYIVKSAVIPLHNDDECNDIYGTSYHSETKICAGKADVDACHGDSGGPLLIYNNGLYEQLGIVSFGRGCADENYPGVYTRLATYNDWIETIIDDESVDKQSSSSGAGSLWFLLILPFWLIRRAVNLHLTKGQLSLHRK